MDLEIFVKKKYRPLILKNLCIDFKKSILMASLNPHSHHKRSQIDGLCEGRWEGRKRRKNLVDMEMEMGRAILEAHMRMHLGIWACVSFSFWGDWDELDPIDVMNTKYWILFFSNWCSSWIHFFCLSKSNEAGLDLHDHDNL